MANDATPSGPRNLPRPSPTARRLFALAKRIGRFSNDHTEQLDFDSYSTLCELEAMLMAYGSLLQAHRREEFLEAEIRRALESLAFMRGRIQPLDR